MNQYEDLLAKATACLSDAWKIDDPVVRARVLELVYAAQQVGDPFASARSRSSSTSMPLLTTK